MAAGDLTQTAANVGLNSDTGQVQIVQAGEAITQGMPVRKDTTASPTKYYQCDANDAEADAQAEGIALTPAALDGYFVVVTGDGAEIDLGATLSVGETYVISDTKGAITVIGDVASGWYTTILGVATAADTLTLRINVSGAATP